MTAPVIRQFVGTIPDKGQAQTAFDTNVDAFLDWQALQFAPDLVAFGTFASNTAAALVAANLPSLTGRALDAVRVNAAANGVEFADVTAQGWALLDDANAAAQRVTLGLAALDCPNSFALEIGRFNSGDRNSVIDLHAHGAPNANDFSARIIRNLGTNGSLDIFNTGTGGLNIQAGAGGLLLNSVSIFASPALTGTPTAPTAAAATDTTQIATTAYTRTAIPNVLNATGSAPIYACRAWVNFNGTGAVAIRASGNVSSITDNLAGDYTVNFATAMGDANYVAVTGGMDTTNNAIGTKCGFANLAGNCRVFSGYLDSAAFGKVDVSNFSVAIFR